MVFGFKYGIVRRCCQIMAVLGLGATSVLAEPVHIAAMGDSLTQGYGLPAEDGFVPQLQNWLVENGAEATVLNAGVSGDTTAGGLSRAAWTLTPDVDAMIVALGGNDLLRGVPPEVSRQNLAGILTAAADAGVPVLLVGMEAPNNYGPDFKQAFDAMYPELAAEYDALLYPSFLRPLVHADLGAAQAYFQADGIHPNAEGVQIVVQAIGPSVVELIERANQ